MKTVKKGPFLGINNRRPDFNLKLRTSDRGGDYLRAADNVEVTNTGNLRRRAAAELVQAISGAHSLFDRYLVRAGVLYAVTLPNYTETLVKVLSNDEPLAWERIGADLYFSNGTDSYRIDATGAVYPWGLPTLPEPTVSTIPGALFAGWYQVALSYVNAVTGEEGGVSPSCNYLLPADSALRVVIPPAVAGATHVNIYCSTVDGSVPLLQGTVELSTPVFDITSITIGREAQQRYEALLPAGTRLFEHNGRLCSVSGDTIYVGLPFRHGYYDPVAGRIQFHDPVAIAISAQMGVYVATVEAKNDNGTRRDRTYFVEGEDLGDVQKLTDVLPYGAVPGTEFKHPNGTQVGWFGLKGLVLGTPAGEVLAVMSDNIDLTPPAAGRSIVFETRGYRRVVSCGWCVNLENLAATTFSSYDFTSAYDGYGTRADGVYLLEGTGDVPYLVDFGREDFGTELKKHLPAVYLGTDCMEPMRLRVVTPQHDFTYDARSASVQLQQQRVDPGHGLRSNWFQLMLVGDAGVDFTLAYLGFAPVASSRRIG